MLAYDYPLGGVLVSVFWIAIWVLWIMLLWHIFGDIFRSDDLSGGGKRRGPSSWSSCRSSGPSST